MAARRQVQAHEALVRLQDSRKDSEVGCAAGVRLHVDTPLLWVQPVRLKRARLDEALDLVDDLVAAVVAGTREACAKKQHADGGSVCGRRTLAASPTHLRRTCS